MLLLSLKSTRKTSGCLLHQLHFQMISFVLPIKINRRSNTTIFWGGSTFEIKGGGGGAGPKARQRQKPPKVMGTWGNFENYVLRNAISSILRGNCKMFICLKSSEFCATSDRSSRHSRPLEMNTSFFKQRLVSKQL